MPSHHTYRAGAARTVSDPSSSEIGRAVPESGLNRTKESEFKPMVLIGPGRARPNPGLWAAGDPEVDEEVEVGPGDDAVRFAEARVYD